MDAIFHERQEGSLCAQHCLNSLLQGPYFSAVDLACIGRELDEAERATMAEGDVTSPEFLRFLQQPSSNVDDSGYFSVQVIGRALKVWGLELIPFGSTEAVQANTNPECEKAFICNFKDHWLTIRKLGQQWFNLNSLLTGPELISDTYLSMLLVQLRNEGYSIFVVRGMLPENEADQLLNYIPAVQIEKPRLLSDVTPYHSGEAPEEDLKTAELDKGSEGVDVKSSNVRPQRLCYDRIRVPVTTQSGSSVPSVSSILDQSQNSQAEPGGSAQPSYKWIPPTESSTSEQRTNDPCLGAEGSSQTMETEDYTNDEQITEAAMLQMAIQMSLSDMQHEGGS